MRYFKQYKDKDAEAVEITREEAKRTLEGWWQEDCLTDIFENNREFRLYTAYSTVWTQTDDGLVPIAGFYGIVG